MFIIVHILILILYSSSVLSYLVYPSLPYPTTHPINTCRVLHILIFWRCVGFILGSRGVQSIKYYHVRLGGWWIGKCVGRYRSGWCLSFIGCLSYWVIDVRCLIVYIHIYILLYYILLLLLYIILYYTYTYIYIYYYILFYTILFSFLPFPLQSSSIQIPISSPIPSFILSHPPPIIPFPNFQSFYTCRWLVILIYILSAIGLEI